VEESLQSVEIELSKDVMKKLDELFPGGEAPEPYTW
jgi:hypothetical protein